MTFNDVFKSSFLDSFSSFSLLDTALCLGAAFVIGLFIFYVYQKTYSGVLYSRSFNVSLVAILMVTTLVICGVTSNVVLSLGMVGALSIVRFRTAVKEPMDLLYLFWSITTGITTGAGMYLLALTAAVVMILMLLLFYHWQERGRVYIAVIHYTGQRAGDDIVRAFGRNKYVVKSKTMRGDTVEMVAEVFCKDKELEFSDRLRAVPGVADVTLIQYNGEYHG